MGVFKMKKRNGFCPRCGETTVGEKRMGWQGHKSSKYGMHTEKKGNVKCLSCQRCDGVVIK
jgi:ribosomal protein S27AE